MNKVFILGNLTKEPELTTLNGNVSVCKFCIAVKRRTPNVTDYFTVISWRVLAENCAKYLGKGSKAAVIGELQNRSYETKDGEKRYVTEIIADEVQFLTGKNAEKNILQENQEVLQENLPF